MLLTRPSRPDDIPAQRQLWNLAFGDDGAYIDNFYRTYYEPQRMLVLEEDGAVRSMTAWFDTTFVVPGQGEYRVIHLRHGRPGLHPGDPVNPTGHAPAGAGGQESGPVPGAVADQGHGFQANGGDHQLPPLSIRNRAAGFVHNFCQNVIFPQVHPLEGRAGYCPAQAAFPAAVVGEEPTSQQVFQRAGDRHPGGFPRSGGTSRPR